MDKVKVYIESAIIPRTEVRPVLAGDFEFKKEAGTIYYRHEAKDAFKFVDKADYELLLTQRVDECGEVTVTVDKLCNGTYSEYWRGVFTIFDATINYTYCWLEVKPDPADDYRCFEQAVKDEYNLFSAGPVVSNTSVSNNSGNYETQTCSRFTADDTEFDTWDLGPYACPAIDPLEWCTLSNVVDGTPSFDQNDNPITEYEQTTVWHREVATTDCVGGLPVEPPYSSGWMVLTDDCAGTNTVTWWRCPGAVGGALAGPYTRGRLFSDVVQDLVASLGCGLTVKSDFFGINPLGDAPVNAAYTYAATNLQVMTFHQKSDVKRRSDTNGSSSAAWDLKAEDFFSDLRRWFNAFFTIDNGVLILEHYSFFTSALGWDLSNESMVKQVDYSGNENVRTEKFYYMDEGSSDAFRAVTITYDCGDEDKEERLRLFSADLVYLEDERFSENVADEGFVLISNDLYQGEYVIRDNNTPLSWANILPALHPWGRLYKSGKIGANPQSTFESWLPYIKQEKFKTDYCCGEDFDPQDLITTDLGNGVVGSATHNVYTGRLELELSY